MYLKEGSRFTTTSYTGVWFGLVATRFLLLSRFFISSFSISLEQVKPPDESPVCPGNTLTYECVTVATLTWEEDGFTYSFVINELNETRSVNRRFSFRLNQVIESTWSSTATITEVNLNDTGIKLRCLENITPRVEFVSVWEAPETCNVEVSCFFSMDGSNIGLSVKDTTGRLCVENYLIEFNGTNKTTSVEENLVTFPTAEIFGSTFLNQKMYEIGTLGSLRSTPCLFSITKPNALDGRINVKQTCDKEKINVAISFERATFPLESCFGPDNITWNYIVNVTSGNYSWNDTIDKEELMIPNTELGAYEVIIAPVATELGLTGSPFPFTVAVSVQCNVDITSIHVLVPTTVLITTENTIVNMGAVVVLGVLFGITLLLLFVACILLLVQYFRRKGIHVWDSFWIFSRRKKTTRASKRNSPVKIECKAQNESYVHSREDAKMSCAYEEIEAPTAAEYSVPTCSSSL